MISIYLLPDFCFKLAYYRLSIEKSPADQRFPLPVQSVFNENIFFYFVTLTPSQSVRNALFIGVSVVRVSVRVNFLLSHLPSHHNPSIIPLVLPRHQYLTLDKASAAHLQDSSDSFDQCSKKTFAYIKLNTNLPLNESFNMQTESINESV